MSTVLIINIAGETTYALLHKNMTKPPIAAVSYRGLPGILSNASCVYVMICDSYAGDAQ